MPWGSKGESSDGSVEVVPSGPVPGGCPDPRHHYKTQVNKKGINMERWEGQLNAIFGQGYRLAHAFEQDGNTVMVFEHHGH